MEWSDETITRLRVMWDEGLSTAEIGRRMGVSKNAVVGKAHRLSLPARPSPIRREASGTPRPAPLRRLTGPTLPPLPVIQSHVAAAQSPPRVTEPPKQPRPEPVVVVAPVAALPAAAPPPVRAVVTRPGRLSVCCWPIGEPGTPSFRFCDDEAVQGKPYCAAHAQLAYVRVRDRREDAA